MSRLVEPLADVVGDDFQPPRLGLRVSSRILHAARGLCEWLADRESQLLGSALDAVPLDRPIFIAGLARSGSTLLLEALAAQPALASARYCDFPPVWFPYWWTHLRARLPLPAPAPRMRAHGDGIEVTPLSPEACDELLWMHFFADRHDPRVDQRLSADCSHPTFEAFYRRHVRKLLLARDADRYLCKGNYNLLRLSYLRRVFPDALFVVPIRAPTGHVRSLQRQHRRFSKLSRRWPAVGQQLALSGHFEFGPQRRAECVEPLVAAAIEADFASGNDLSAYARQWACSYGAFAVALQNDPGLASQVLLLHHERVCADPATALAELATHCQLPADSIDGWLDQWCPRIRAEGALREPLDPATLELLQERCQGVAEMLGYASVTGELA